MKKIKLIIISTLMLILILGTISQAGTTLPNTMTGEDIKNIINFFIDAQDYLYDPSINVETRKGYGTALLEAINLNEIANLWNTSIDTSIYPSLENICIYGYLSNDSLTLYLIPNNNTIGDIDPFLKVEETHPSYNPYSQVYFYMIDENKNSITPNRQILKINLNKASTFNTSTNATIGNSLLLNNVEISDTATTCNIPTLLGLNMATSIWFKTYSTNVYSWYLNENYIFTSNNNTSGDEDDGNDVPSGDYGPILGSIDKGIENINNNLENIQQNMPNSGDIKDAQLGANTEFWGNTDEIKEEDFENQIKEEINEIMETMSGELSQNQIFSELQSIENGFLNFFDKNQDEKFYDLAFEWDNIELYNTTLIPEGKINISQMCRDIETLGYIQTLTRTLFCFGTCVLIIKQIYNLILSTLGIDNPYLYEDPNTEHISYAYDVNTSTGEIKETSYYRKGNRTFRYHK